MRNYYIFIAALSVVMIVILMYSFSLVGSPLFAYEKKFDDKRMQDIRDIATQIDTYYSTHHELPLNLDQITWSSSYYNGNITDPKTKEKYEYSLVTDVDYKLCATFATEYKDTHNYESYQGDYYRPYSHQKGHQCFSLHPPGVSYLISPTPYPFQPQPIRIQQPIHGYGID